jgi:TonB family protein
MILANPYRFALCLLAFSSNPVMALPEPELSEHIATVVQAQPIKRVNPTYPASSIRQHQEGWVRVSFVINEDGEVEDPVVQDSSGLRAFEKAALRATKRWQYSPAMQDGKPIQQCRNMVQLDFRLTGKSGVTRKFKARYKEVADAINNNDLPFAAELIAKMKDDQLWNLTESAFFWLVDSSYAKATGDHIRELESVRRSLAIESDAISKSTTRYLLEREFVLSVAQNQYSQAMQAYTRLEPFLQSEPELQARLAPYAEKVNSLIRSTEPIVREASISEKGRVFHQLSRNAFALNIAEGDLDEVQIRCDNKLSRFTAVSQSEWHIPASWGQCSVFVSGSPGARFRVIEVGEYIGEI